MCHILPNKNLAFIYVATVRGSVNHRALMKTGFTSKEKLVLIQNWLRSEGQNISTSAQGMTQKTDASESNFRQLLFSPSGDHPLHSCTCPTAWAHFSRPPLFSLNHLFSSACPQIGKNTAFILVGVSLSLGQAISHKSRGRWRDVLFSPASRSRLKLFSLPTRVTGSTLTCNINVRGKK